MKKMILIAVILMSAGLMLQSMSAYAADDSSYEEDTQGYEDSSGYSEDMPTDEESSDSEQGYIPDETDDSETTADN